jgi:hypothetical protein
MSKTINWAKVEEAMARSTRGHASQADTDLCTEAFNLDRETYREVNRRVRAQVQREVNPFSTKEYILNLQHVDEQYSGDHWATGNCPRCNAEIALGIRDARVGGRTLEENRLFLREALSLGTWPGKEETG